MSEQDLARLIATLAHLRHPFDRKQISKLPATDKRPALDYVNHAHVTNRLNEYAPDWSYTLDDVFTEGGECWVRGTMTIYGASRVEFGSGKNPLEAVSHFIRRAAMRFGVATDLWAKEDFEDSRRPEALGEGAEGRDPKPQGKMTDRGEGRGTNESAVRVGQPEAEGPGKGAGSDLLADSTPLPLPIDEPDLPATSVQWERLLTVVGGSKVKAVNRLNRVNKTNYTQATSEGATRAEVSLAITGDR